MADHAEIIANAVSKVAPVSGQDFLEELKNSLGKFIIPTALEANT